MEYNLVDTEEITIIGMRTEMSLLVNTTSHLWKQFMPRRKEVAALQEDEYYSVHNIPEGLDMAHFNPTTKFEKWASVRVAPDAKIPHGMHKYTIPAGRYAVFFHKGNTASFMHTWQQIHLDWLPKSDFELDDRPNFEVLGDNYKGPTDPDSEEHIWVPVREK